MATTQNTFNGNGSNLGPFSFTFKWLESTDIKVSVGGVLKTAGTHYNLQGLNYTTKTGGQVLFTAGNAPPVGTNNIRIYRDTDDEVLSAVFSSGSAIRAKDLNDNFTQNLYVTQETNNNSLNVDGSNPMVGPLNMNGFQIDNLGEPTTDSDAATKKYIDDRYGNLGIPGHTRWRKVATASQTTFSGTGDYGGVLAYSPTREQVYINGALQQRGVDYAADNGTSVAFTVGLTVGDVVDIICVNNLTNSSVSNAGNITYSGQFTGQTARTVAAKLADVVSVKDFGAVGDGVTDDTLKFEAAIATGKAVYVPYTPNGYVVNNVRVTTNTVIYGEKPGISSGPTLKVTTSGAAAFVPADTTGPIFHLKFANFVVTTSATNVTGAAFWRHSNKTHYTAYVEFSDIETSTSLETAYDGFFIFAAWSNCRDGYIGNINTNTTHTAISSVPASYSQGNQTNLNTLTNCHFFGDTTISNSAAAIIDVAYGDLWKFQSCDFEGIKTRAVRLRGVGSTLFDSCWFERVSATENVLVDVTPSNPKGSGAHFINCYGLLTNTTQYFTVFGAASVGFFDTCAFVQVPAGVKLATGIVRRIQNVSSSGVGGGSAFLTGYADAFFYLNGNISTEGNITAATGNITATAGNISATAGNISADAGTVTAYNGIKSRYNITVTTSPTLISAKNGIFGLVYISGYANGTGVQFWYLVSIGNPTGTTVIASYDPTTTNPTFSEGVGGLYMQTGGGSLQVFCSTIG